MAGENLEIRDLHFDLDGVPRHWHGGRRSVTLFLNALSILFPPGERFFIASVKAHANQVTDPKLQADIKLFCGQEGVHGREHIAYNRMIAAHGYPAEAMERGVKGLLYLGSGFPKGFRLAFTCALEHFTALMAHFLLSDPRLLEGAHPSMAALWRWHAAEENEHKAVAFDVYQATGGSYLVRVIAMIMVTIVFWAYIFVEQVWSMWVDGCLFNPAEWYRLGRYLFVEPGGMLNMVPPYFSYFRPSFHPWDHDNQALLESWKSELGTSPVYQGAFSRPAKRTSLRPGALEAGAAL